jgi:hypothetical protein
MYIVVRFPWIHPINFFVIESLDAALQKPIFNFGSQSITIKLKQKKKGGRNLRNILYMYRILTSTKSTTEDGS